MSLFEKPALHLLLALALAAVSLAGAPAVLTASGKQAPAAIAPGSLVEGVYRNVTFGFRYKVPFGWVDRTPQMRESSSDRSLLLLEVFERPPEVEDSIDPAVVITAEEVSVYPGLKTAADYFEPLTQITGSKGFHVVNPPYYFETGSRQLVRGDFSREAGESPLYQSSLVIIDKGFIVSFSFLGASQGEVDELIRGLNFTPTRKAGTRN